MSLQKTAWLLDSGPLLERFERWRPEATPPARWYLDTIAVPGVRAFAPLVPIAELGAGLAFIFGLYTRIVAALALIMVINFHIATSAVFTWTFLRDGTGPPLLAGLLALAIDGRERPFAFSKRRRQA